MEHQNYSALLTTFEKGLSRIIDRQLSPAKRLRSAVPFIKKTLTELNEKVRNESFGEAGKEIDFFKNIKPKINAELIYELELYKLLMNQPAGTKELVYDYYLKQLKKTQEVFHEYAFQYQYFKSGNIELDNIFFSSHSRDEIIIAGEVADEDPEFSTGMDIIFARFIALEKLQNFILAKIDNPNQESGNASELSVVHSLIWTGESINLVEVAYGIWLTGQLNHGRATITEIMHWLEEHFDIKIGRAYRRWTEISQRKQVSTTKYLDQMVTQINKRVEDENDLKSQKRRSSRQN